jgi:hypothetical protein
MAFIHRLTTLVGELLCRRPAWRCFASTRYWRHGGRTEYHGWYLFCSHFAPEIFSLCSPGPFILVLNMPTEDTELQILQQLGAQVLSVTLKPRADSNPVSPIIDALTSAFEVKLLFPRGSLVVDRRRAYCRISIAELAQRNPMYADFCIGAATARVQSAIPGSGSHRPRYGWRIRNQNEAIYVISLNRPRFRNTRAIIHLKFVLLPRASYNECQARGICNIPPAPDHPHAPTVLRNVEANDETDFSELSSGGTTEPTSVEEQLAEVRARQAYLIQEIGETVAIINELQEPDETD